MTKYIIRIEADKIKWFKIKKAHRELISLHGRLYSNYDRYYVKDKHSSDAVRITPIDSNQVAKNQPIPIDPNDIRAKIMSKEISGNKKKSLLNLNPSAIMMWILGGIIAVVVVYTILTGGLKL